MDSEAPSPNPVSVLFLLTDLRVGGMERKVVEIVTKGDPVRMRPSVACLKEAGDLAPVVRQAGVEVVDRLLRHKWDLLVLWRLWRLIRKRGIQVVCTIGDGGDRMFWGRLAARLAGVEGIVSTLHSTRNPRGGRILDRPNRWLIPFNDAYVAVAQGAARYLIQHEDLPADRIVVIPNGVDLETFQGSGRDAARADLNLSPQAPVVAHVAAFRPEKNHRLLLQAAQKVLPDFPEAVFLLVGEGPTQGATEFLAKELGISKAIRFLGRRQDIPEILAAADLLVLCSQSAVETFPNCVLEAMASRLPVVSTQVGSVDEQIQEGVSGYLVPVDDASSLADRIAALMRDRDTARAMGARGRKIAEEQYSAKRMIRAREDLFLSLVAGQGIPSGLQFKTEHPPSG